MMDTESECDYEFLLTWRGDLSLRRQMFRYFRSRTNAASLKPESGTIEVSGPAATAIEHIFLPLTPEGVERLAQKILEPALFPDQLAMIAFREAVEAKRA
jgi:hypothetical protein